MGNPLELNLVNLTPHELKIHNGDIVLTLPPSGKVARVASNSTLVNSFVTNENGKNVTVNVYDTSYGEVVNLPPYRPSDMVMYVVSGMVNSAVPNRHDVCSPGELIRDENGRPVGCRGLRR